MTFRVPTQQYSFTSGMLDDTLEARSDIRAYYAGGREIQNMLGLPQGGVDMRGGLAFVAEIPEASSGVRMAPFEFSTEQKYLHVFTDQKLHVYKDDVKQVEIATPWTGAQLGQIDWTQSLDTMIMVHPDVKYRKVMRQGAHDAWDISELSISNIPQYDFDGDGEGAAEDTSRMHGVAAFRLSVRGALVFRRIEVRPQTIWGSSSNNFFDFKVTTPDQLDDDSEMTMDNDWVSAVEQLYALDDFSFVRRSVRSDGKPNHADFYFARNSELPAANIRPVEPDGSVAFIRRGADGHHQSLHELACDDGQICTTRPASWRPAQRVRLLPAAAGQRKRQREPPVCHQRRRDGGGPEHPQVPTNHRLDPGQDRRSGDGLRRGRQHRLFPDQTHGQRRKLPVPTAATFSMRC